MDTALWLFHWFCFFIGAFVLFFLGIVYWFSFLFFLADNWFTLITPEKIYISRITGLRSVKWFIFDIHKNTKEFGVLVRGKEKFILQRRLSAVDRHFPAFEIFHENFLDGGQMVISFYSGNSIFVRRKNRGMRWSAVEFSVSKFQETQYAELVKKATGLQVEIEKRFKHLMPGASRK